MRQFSVLLIFGAMIMLMYGCHRTETREFQRVRKTERILSTLCWIHIEYSERTGLRVNDTHDLTKFLEIIEDSKVMNQIGTDVDWVQYRDNLRKFTDAWGNPLVIVRRESGVLSIVSNGTDGTFGTSDDITLVF